MVKPEHCDECLVEADNYFQCPRCKCWLCPRCYSGERDAICAWCYERELDAVEEAE